MTRLIIDTDPGIDDAMAIHMAFAHPGLEVAALTGIFGNVTVDQATRNALRLAAMAGVACPVARGADSPLAMPGHPPAHFVHGDEGFGTVPAATPDRAPDPRPAHVLIADLVNAHPGEIWLCPIGPLTNIALALRHDPGIADRVAGVSVMGGAVRHPGNVTPWAEANIWNDPHAAAEVMAAGWPVTLIGLDVTEQTRASPGDFAALAEQAPCIGGFLDEAVQFYFDWHRQKDVHDGCFLHDPCAVLAAVEPGLFTFEEIRLSVITDGDEIGRTAPDPAGRPVRVATGVDRAALNARVMGLLATADRVAASRLPPGADPLG